MNLLKIKLLKFYFHRLKIRQNYLKYFELFYNQFPLNQECYLFLILNLFDLKDYFYLLY